MAPIPKSTAETALQPLIVKLGQCFQEAWGEWTSFYAPNHHILDARARASIVFCHIADRAMALFAGIPGVKPVRKNASFRLYIGDEIALRFKKAKPNGTTSNINTNQQRLIDSQQVIQGVLPGTFLNAVYQLDDLQRAIARMMVTQQLEGKIQWSIEINAASAQSSPATMPTAPSSQQAPISKRARVKGQNTKTRAATIAQL